MRRPESTILEGYGVRLEPLETAHGAALVKAAADGDLWKLWYVSVADVQSGRIDGYITTALNGQHHGLMVPWVVRELTTGDIIGSTRFHDINVPIGRVEIGFTFYAQRWQRTHVNAACKLLLLQHAFDALGSAVVGFRVDGVNTASQRAMESIGAHKDGVLRHFQARADGSPRDLVMYSILDREWPTVRATLMTRLERLTGPSAVRRRE